MKERGRGITKDKTTNQFSWTLMQHRKYLRIMQVEVNVMSMHTNFDGCRHSGFGDIATFKNGQISLSDHQGCCNDNCNGN